MKVFAAVRAESGTAPDATRATILSTTGSVIGA
jgi:hypothetical protein